MSSKPHIEKLRQLLQPPNGACVVDKNGKVLPPSSTVFKELSMALTTEYPNMSPKNIYTMLISRRYNLYDEVVAALGISNINVSATDTLNSTTNDSMNDITEFRIDITEAWLKIQPEIVSYTFKDKKTRDINCFKRHTWTSTLYEKIWLETKIPCAISFRNAKISQSGIFVKVSGICPECKCIFSGRIANKPKIDENVVMECAIEGFDTNVVHKKKRQLRGQQRTILGTHLADGNILPCQWRRKEADKLMLGLGEREPPHLYSGKVLSAAKQQTQDALLDIRSNNVFESLWIMMYSQKFNGAIKKISLDPLMVMYWTKEQEAVYQQYHERVYIDGTGSLVKKIQLPNGDLCPHIYLYQIVTQIAEKTAPIGQMISSAHSTDDIAIWLRTFTKSIYANQTTIRVPRECVTDFDRALLGAAAQALANVTSLRNYLEICFELLSGNNSSTKYLPQCYLRLDVCHFANMVAKWKCFKDKHPQVRKFYLHAVAILRQSKTFDSFKEISRAILMLALNHKGQPRGLAEKSRNYLVEKMRGSSVDDSENVASDTEDIEEMEGVSEMTNTNLYQWVGALYEDVLKQADAENSTLDLNGYHCLGFAKKIKNLLIYFPLFTEVMHGVFQYGSFNATSAAVESEFSDLKRRTFNNISLPLRVDKFVARHILSLAGKIKLATADVKIESSLDEKDQSREDDPMPLSLGDEISTSSKLQKEIADPLSDINTCKRKKNIIDAEEAQAEHNWRNKNQSRRKKFKYGDPCPWINADKFVLTDLPTIPNGNLCPVVREREKSFVIRNTCGFDSLCQIIAVTAINESYYKDAIVNCSSPIFTCVKEFLCTGLSKKFYVKRVNALNIPNLLSENRSRRIIQIIATSNVADMATWIFKDDASCIKTKHCLACEKENSRKIIVISADFDIWVKEGAIGLAKAVTHGINRDKLCCDVSPTITFNYGQQLLIETGFNDKTSRLENFPEHIIMPGDTTFRLAGIVAYEGQYDTI